MRLRSLLKTKVFVGGERAIEAPILLATGQRLRLDSFRELIINSIQEAAQAETKKIQDRVANMFSTRSYSITGTFNTEERIVIPLTTTGALKYFMDMYETDAGCQKYCIIEVRFTASSNEYESDDSAEDEPRRKKRRLKSKDTDDVGVRTWDDFISKGMAILSEMNVAEVFLLKAIRLQAGQQQEKKWNVPQHEDKISTYYEKRYLQISDGDNSQLVLKTALEKLAKKFQEEESSAISFIELLQLQKAIYAKGIGLKHVAVGLRKVKCGFCQKTRKLNADSNLYKLEMHVERCHKEDLKKKENLKTSIGAFMAVTSGELMILPSVGSYPNAHYDAQLSEKLAQIKEGGYDISCIRRFLARGEICLGEEQFGKILESVKLWQDIGVSNNLQVEAGGIVKSKDGKERFRYLTGLEKQLEMLTVDGKKLLFMQCCLVENQIAAVVHSCFSMECLKCSRVIELPALVEGTRSIDTAFQWGIFKVDHWQKFHC